MLTIDNIERNINELTELKNTTRKLSEICTNLNSWIDRTEERISEVEDLHNEIKREDKNREKRMKRNEQSLQEIWDYVRRPNLHLIGGPEYDKENESELENTLQDIIQENFPNLAKQHNIQPQVIQRTPQIYSSRRATPRHVIVIYQLWNEGENTKGSQRERSGYPQREAYLTYSRSLSRNPTSQKRVGANIQHP